MTVLLGLMAAGGVIGIGLLVVGVRGRKIDDHPVCRRCRFDLIGLPGAASCPECGADLSRRGAVRLGQRKRRPRVVAIGALALGLSLLLAAGLLSVRVAGISLNTYKPVWMLTGEAVGINQNVAAAARSELLARHKASAITASQARSIADMVLARQADALAEWDPQLGVLLETLWAAGLVDDNQLNIYAKEGTRFSLRAPSRAPQGARGAM